MKSHKMQKNACLANLFRNQDEHCEPVEAVVTGKIPEWIRGTYIRVGPGKFDFGDTTMRHYLDGYAMVTKFGIHDGKVEVMKRYIESDAYKKAILAKKPIFGEFATKGHIGEGKNLFNRVIDVFGSANLTDNVGINMYEIEGNLYACSETCHIHNIDPDTLVTRNKKIDLYKYFGIYLATAHPLKCRKTGDLFNIGTSFKPTVKYQVMRIPNLCGSNAKDAMKKSEVFATIYPSWNTYVSYYHSFVMTDNYIVMIEQPLLMSIIQLAESKLTGKGMRDTMEWTPTERNRFHVVDKRNGEVLKTKYYSEVPFFYFHIANAYEDEDNNIVMDVNTYADDHIMDQMFIDNLRRDCVTGDDVSQLTRFYLPIIKSVKQVSKNVNLITDPLTTATAFRDSENSIILSGEDIGEPGFEGPIVNPEFIGKKHKYVFGTGTCLPGFYANSICKVDIQTGDVKLWKDCGTIYPGEPVFLCPEEVNNNSEREEDDGVLMAAISDSQVGKKDFLVFIDPKTMTEIARASVSIQIPQALHGVFLPSSSS